MPKANKRQKKPDPSHVIRLTPITDSIFPPIEEFPWSSVMGRFSGLWIVLLTTPSRPWKNQDSGNYVWLSSPFTAAGPRRILTVFPKPKHLPLLELLYNPETVCCQYLFWRFLISGRAPLSSSPIRWGRMGRLRLPPCIFLSTYVPERKNAIYKKKAGKFSELMALLGD